MTTRLVSSGTELIRPISVTIQLVERIRAEILDVRLGPGDTLVEGDLAGRWGNSIGSVRQALLQLEHEGLLVRSPRKGARIPNFTRNEIKERNDVRVPLEIMACQRAAYQITDPEYDTLKDVARSMPHDPDADRKFHHYIWKRANQGVLETTLQTVVSPLFAFVPLARMLKDNLDHRASAHESLLLTVRSQDHARIEREVRKHIENAYDHFFSDGWEDLRSMYDAVRDRRKALDESKVKE